MDGSVGDIVNSVLTNVGCKDCYFNFERVCTYVGVKWYWYGNWNNRGRGKVYWNIDAFNPQMSLLFFECNALAPSRLSDILVSSNWWKFEDVELSMTPHWKGLINMGTEDLKIIQSRPSRSFYQFTFSHSNLRSRNEIWYWMERRCWCTDFQNQIFAQMAVGGSLLGDWVGVGERW